MPRPFLHGLCTLAASLLPLADRLGVHPADLVELDARFAAPVFPGDRLTLHGWDDAPGGTAVRFEASDGEHHPVLSGGHARFGAAGLGTARLGQARSAPGTPPRKETPDA